MARKILYVVAFIGLSLALLAYVVTRPGELVTPTVGTITSMVKPLRHSRYLTM